MSNTAYRHFTGGDLIKIREAECFYASFLEYAQSIFADVTNNGKLDINSISEMIKTVYHQVRYNRRFLMSVLTHAEPASEENYLVSHSGRATIIAMIIGSYFKLPHYRIVELGIATLLHDIGMLKLPSVLYLTSRSLTAHEKKLLQTHSAQGYKLLKSFHCPMDVCLAVLEHHEREDGSGYPGNLAGSEISLYAKIIAVACSYEALSTKRLYKKAKDQHMGILELVKNEGKRYNGAIVRALVDTLSIYPIGLYVLLSNGKMGQVVDVNPDFQRYPIVQLLEQANEGKKTTINTFCNSVFIIRPLTREEVKKDRAG